MRSHKSVGSYSANRSSSEGYRPMNSGYLKSKSEKMSRPDLSASPAQAGVANSTFKNKA